MHHARNKQTFRCANGMHSVNVKQLYKPQSVTRLYFRVLAHKISMEEMLKINCSSVRCRIWYLSALNHQLYLPIYMHEKKEEAPQCYQRNFQSVVQNKRLVCCCFFRSKKANDSPLEIVS